MSALFLQLRRCLFINFWELQLRGSSHNCPEGLRQEKFRNQKTVVYFLVRISFERR